MLEVFNCQKPGEAAVFMQNATVNLILPSPLTLEL